MNKAHGSEVRANANNTVLNVSGENILIIDNKETITVIGNGA